MADIGIAVNRSLFEIENARNLTREQLVHTFVPTRAFRRLISSKNHVILGSRGSGKTAIAKMLSHDHLACLQDPQAQEVIRTKSFIGIYVPTRLEWVGALTSKPWQSEREAERLFQWRLNLASCVSFLDTLHSCLERYISDDATRLRTELRLTREIGQAWDVGVDVKTTDGLRRRLQDIEYDHQQALARARVSGNYGVEVSSGVAFEAELFAPLKRAIKLTERSLSLSADCTWALCLDEAELLEKSHHRILNSHLRAWSDNLVFKLATMPYQHHTLETNTGVPLNVGDDFEYVYIDQDQCLPYSSRNEFNDEFTAELFVKRAAASGGNYAKLTLRELVGASELLDRDTADWGPESQGLELLRRYATPKTVARAERLARSSVVDFKNQIARKLNGALLLRHAVEEATGNTELDVYSGEAMIARCGDGNPRRLIRLFNALLLELPHQSISAGSVGEPLISKRNQTRVLIRFSASALDRVQSEPKLGKDLYQLLKRIGTYMRDFLHNRPLTTDQLSSVQITRQTDQHYWRLVKWAVALGLLHPNVSNSNPDILPQEEGVFRLAYVLAPYFRILPRRGKSRLLATMLTCSARSDGEDDSQSLLLWDERHGDDSLSEC